MGAGVGDATTLATDLNATVGKVVEEEEGMERERAQQIER